MSWERLSDAAAEATVWGLIADVAEERKDAARAWLANHMGPDAAAVKAIANGETIGRATWVEPKDSVTVTSEIQFYEYIRRKLPDALITTVNPAVRKAVLDNARIVDGQVIDRDGEPIYGVEVRGSNPYVSVKKSPAAREVVEQLLDGGRLSLDGITQPQLEGGQS
ncbi:hypothetical protein A5677_17030 [Mycobacterium malmoense]|uniref:Uncharacterized protein n=1 Tax=Mycobacterium malmoense TaxID=1780 RepID=A0A1B9DAC8_MYCMA|nr:hypothetical protein [Mycobacterium malmoense]OCB57667.1 hypothetical protein A5677_17030 [Mycobacterium malmoense]